MKTKYFLYAALVLLSCGCAKKIEPSQKWTEAQAWDWYNHQGWITGCNFTPKYAINQIEMWHKDTYNRDEIDKELAWAEELGFNTMRVFLSSLVWENDPDGFKQRLDDFLDISDEHGIHPFFVFFDDCWNPESSYGPQPEPVPGKHNSGWIQDPPASSRADTVALYAKLEPYVKDICGRYRNDKRVLMWDVYNEPGSQGHGAESVPLLKKAFQWVREAGVSQPLTSGIYYSPTKEIDRCQLENSDVVSFHCYEEPEVQMLMLDTLSRYGRPLICTEWLARPLNSTIQNTFPLFFENKVGAVNWGFVSGKTNTIYTWGQIIEDGSEPEVWLHDILRSDGTPYSEEEVSVLKEYNHRR